MGTRQGLEIIVEIVKGLVEQTHLGTPTKCPYLYLMLVHGPEENDMIKYWYIIKSYSKFNNSTTIRSRNPMIWQRNKNLLGLGREFIKKMIIPSQKYWLADILKGHVDPIKKKRDTLIGKGER